MGMTMKEKETKFGKEFVAGLDATEPFYDAVHAASDKLREIERRGDHARLSVEGSEERLAEFQARVDDAKAYLAEHETNVAGAVALIAEKEKALADFKVAEDKRMEKVIADLKAA